MKTASDPRHQKRVDRMKALFSYSFSTTPPPAILQTLITNLPQIDAIITRCAPDWPLSQINKIDLAVLRSAIYELSQADTPQKVVIDEAVEIAKEYGSENSAKFVNGVLGSALKQLTYE